MKATTRHHAAHGRFAWQERKSCGYGPGAVKDRMSATSDRTHAPVAQGRRGHRANLVRSWKDENRQILGSTGHRQDAMNAKNKKSVGALLAKPATADRASVTPAWWLGSFLLLRTAAALCSLTVLLAGCAAPKVVYFGPSDAKPSAVPAEVQRVAAEAARKQGLQLFGLVPCKSKDAAQRWAAVAAQGDANKGFVQARSFLFLETNGSARLVATSEALNDPRFGEPIEQAHLWIKAVDLDGDGTDEIVIDTGFQGASWAPDCAFVFRAAPTGLVHLATDCAL